MWSISHVLVNIEFYMQTYNLLLPQLHVDVDPMIWSQSVLVWLCQHPRLAHLESLLCPRHNQAWNNVQIFSNIIYQWIKLQSFILLLYFLNIHTSAFWPACKVNFHGTFVVEMISSDVRYLHSSPHTWNVLFIQKTTNPGHFRQTSI